MMSPTSSTSSLSSLSSAPSPSLNRTSEFGVSVGSSSSLNNLLELDSDEQWLEDFLNRFRNVFAPQPVADSISPVNASENQENDSQNGAQESEQIIRQEDEEGDVVGHAVAEDLDKLIGKPGNEKSLGCCVVFQLLFGKYFRGF